MFVRNRCCDAGPIAGLVGHSRPSGVAGRRGGWLARLGRRTLGSMVFAGALLLPKCPLCVAAWAAAAGIGVTGSHFLAQVANPRVRPFVLAMLLLPFSLQVVLGARTMLRRRRSNSAQTTAPSGPGLDPAFPENCTHSRSSGY